MRDALLVPPRQRTALQGTLVAVWRHDASALVTAASTSSGRRLVGQALDVLAATVEVDRPERVLDKAAR